MRGTLKCIMHIETLSGLIHIKSRNRSATDWLRIVTCSEMSNAATPASGRKFGRLAASVDQA